MSIHRDLLDPIYKIASNAPSNNDLIQSNGSPKSPKSSNVQESQLNDQNKKFSSSFEGIKVDTTENKMPSKTVDESSQDDLNLQQVDEDDIGCDSDDEPDPLALEVESNSTIQAFQRRIENLPLPVVVKLRDSLMSKLH